MRPDDPRHGKASGYDQHRRDGETPCEPCRIGKNRYSKLNRWLQPQGKTGYVDLDQQVTAALTDARNRGLTYQQIADRAGIGFTSIWRWCNNGPNQRIRKDVRTKLLAANLHQPPLTHTGTVRRIQALHAIGYSYYTISAEAGTSPELSREIIDGEASQHATRQRFADAYNRLHMTIPPHNRWTSRARNDAAKHGWPPPMAWDPETIDDPHTQPAGAALWRDNLPPDSIDWVIIQRRLDGHKTRHLTQGETQELIQRAHTLGLTERQIGVNGYRYKEPQPREVKRKQPARRSEETPRGVRKESIRSAPVVASEYARPEDVRQWAYARGLPVNPRSVREYALLIDGYNKAHPDRPYDLRRHGSETRYQVGCRCDECRAAWRDAKRLRRIEAAS